jgi:hypothetical protein
MRCKVKPKALSVGVGTNETMELNVTEKTFVFKVTELQSQPSNLRPLPTTKPRVPGQRAEMSTTLRVRVLIRLLRPASPPFAHEGLRCQW